MVYIVRVTDEILHHSIYTNSHSILNQTRSFYRVRKLDNSASISTFSPVDFARSSINSARVSSSLEYVNLDVRLTNKQLYCTLLRVEHYQHWHDVNPSQVRLNFCRIHQLMIEIRIQFEDEHMDNATKLMDTNPNLYYSTDR